MEIREEGLGEGKEIENVFMEENTPTQSSGCGLSETVGFAAKKASSHHTFLLYTVSMVRNGFFIFIFS